MNNKRIIDKKVSVLETIEEWFTFSPKENKVSIAIPIDEFSKEYNFYQHQIESILEEFRENQIIVDYLLYRVGHSFDFSTMTLPKDDTGFEIKLGLGQIEVLKDYKNKLIGDYNNIDKQIVIGKDMIIDIMPEPQKNNLTLYFSKYSNVNFKFRDRGRVIEFFFNNRGKGTWYRSNDIGSITSAQLEKMVKAINRIVGKNTNGNIVQIISIKDKPDGSRKQNEYRWSVY
jgi:hypothetical protein